MFKINWFIDEAYNAVGFIIVPFIDVLLLYKLQVWKHQNIKFKSKTKTNNLIKSTQEEMGNYIPPPPNNFNAHPPCTINPNFTFRPCLALACDHFIWCSTCI